VEELPRPAGFGNCPHCAYAASGTAAICYDCATATFERLSPNRCPLCELQLNPDDTCSNPVCNWTEDERGFRWVWAISMRTGALAHAIDWYKVHGRRGWAWIFGRVLVGYLNANAEAFEDYDLIIPSPTYVGPDGRAFDHIGGIIDRAIIEDDEHWPFTFGGIVKTSATTPFRGKTWKRRYEIATTELAPALAVPNTSLVAGRRILVFDDVYTEGLTIRTVALALRAAGAVEVSEIVLARQPYGGAR
jgi:predicted amidophosphoribosyltransferase